MFETGTVRAASLVRGRAGRDHFLSRAALDQLFEYRDSEQKIFCRLDPLR
jgi:hypothetical protein